jgi:hypothetical protein
MARYALIWVRDNSSLSSGNLKLGYASGRAIVFSAIQRLQWNLIYIDRVSHDDSILKSGALVPCSLQRFYYLTGKLLWLPSLLL